jgi:hypothetical protein
MTIWEVAMFATIPVSGLLCMALVASITWRV